MNAVNNPKLGRIQKKTKVQLRKITTKDFESAFQPQSSSVPGIKGQALKNMNSKESMMSVIPEEINNKPILQKYIPPVTKSSSFSNFKLTPINNEMTVTPKSFEIPKLEFKPIVNSQIAQSVSERRPSLKVI